MCLRRKPVYCDYSLFSKLMETTPCQVRPYVIPMLFCVVVSTTTFKAQPDFAPREIFTTDFHSGDTYALSVVLFQDFCPSVFVLGHDWSVTKCSQSRDILHQIPLAMKGQPENSIDNSNNTVPIRINTTCMHIDQKDSIHIL